MTREKFYDELLEFRHFHRLPSFERTSGFYELCKCFSDIEYFSEIDYIKPMTKKAEKSYSIQNVDRAKLWLQEFIDEQIEPIDQKALLEAIREMHKLVREDVWLRDELFDYMFFGE